MTSHTSPTAPQPWNIARTPKAVLFGVLSILSSLLTVLLLVRVYAIQQDTARQVAAVPDLVSTEVRAIGHATLELSGWYRIAQLITLPWGILVCYLILVATISSWRRATDDASRKVAAAAVVAFLASAVIHILNAETHRWLFAVS